jgi:hypothetical protein
MIPSGYGEISVHHTGGGIDGEAVWTIGFDNNAADTAAAIAENVSDAIDTLGYLDALSSSVTVEKVHVKLGPDDTGPSADFSNGNPGTNGGHAAPPNVSYLVTKNTALGGRKGRGRCYVPGVPEVALQDGGAVEGAFVATLQGFFTDWGGAMVLASKPLHLLHGDATSPTAIDSLVVQSRFATQRRRLRR